MSTRGLIGFVHNGQVRAVFNPHSSYLAFLGRQIVGFCDLVTHWDAFINHYEKIVWTEELNNIKPQSLIGVELLSHIGKGKVEILLDKKGFANDELLCEFAYLLNLDTRELEIYASNIQTNCDQSEKHLPMNLLAKFPLDNIPSHWEDFIELRTRHINVDWKKQLTDRGIDIPDDLDI